MNIKYLAETIKTILSINNIDIDEQAIFNFLVAFYKIYLEIAEILYNIIYNINDKEYLEAYYELQ